ncbi:MAG: hypothetical protein EOP67_04525 [Sphingomonas sp.]|nr:MAG: hypothetical protein EOP67_04525 [Sphingomonas sp.]
MPHLIGSAVDPSASLVSLCEFRLRAARVSADDTDEDYEPLASVVREVGRELAADGVLVAWHAEGGAPTFLFASGACEPQSAIEREMLEAARIAARPDRAAPVRWAAHDREPGADALLTTTVAAPGGVITVTTLFRRISGSAMVGARDASLRMLPMVQGFFRLWSLRARSLAVNRGLTAALNSSDVATLLVNASGGVIFANAAAEGMLAAGDGLRRSGTMLAGSRLADTLRLQAAIEHVANGGDEASMPSPVVALSGKSERPLLAAIMPADRTGKGSEDVAVIVHVFDPDYDLEPLLAPVCRLYALSPVETKLASLLARGSALGDAAKQMRVQEQTARSYLKQIFLKTDTNRQAELVWLMLKSAVRTGPAHPTRFV